MKKQLTERKIEEARARFREYRLKERPILSKASGEALRIARDIANEVSKEEEFLQLLQENPEWIFGLPGVYMQHVKTVADAVRFHLRFLLQNEMELFD